MKTIIHLHENFRLPPWQEWMADLPRQVAALPSSQLIRGGRNRVYWMEHHGQKFVVKHFLNKGPWKKVVYRFFSGKARRSFDNSMALIEAGVLSPQPVAWREDWSGPFLKESFYVSLWVEEAESAKVLRHATAPEWQPYVPKVAQCIARMHNAGLLHRDLNGGNILFVKNGSEGDLPIYIIDNNRMRFGPISQRAGIQSILQAKIGSEYRPEFLTAYATARGFDPDACIKLHDDLIGGHQMKRRIKNSTRRWRRKIGL